MLEYETTQVALPERGLFKLKNVSRIKNDFFLNITFFQNTQ